ncbi:MAG: integration host factor subunit beta [bacterium]|nr:integration host factor subunit beta [bacterium]
MTKADLAKAIAKKHNLTQKEAIIIINAILDTITESLVNDDKVELRGFGNFFTKTRKARMARNPKTGEQVYVPEKRIPAFKASKALKNELIEKTY